MEEHSGRAWVQGVVRDAATALGADADAVVAALSADGRPCFRPSPCN